MHSEKNSHTVEAIFHSREWYKLKELLNLKAILRRMEFVSANYSTTENKDFSNVCQKAVTNEEPLSNVQNYSLENPCVHNAGQKVPTEAENSNNILINSEEKSKNDSALNKDFPNICQEAVRNEGPLKNVKKYSEEKPYVHNVCQKESTESSDNDISLQSEEEADGDVLNNDFSSICPKAATTEERLNNVQNYKEKPYVHNVCQKGSAEISNNDSLIQSEEKAEDNILNKNFSSVSQNATTVEESLSNILEYSKEKLYVQGVYQKRFTETVNSNNHLLNQSEDKEQDSQFSNWITKNLLCQIANKDKKYKCNTCEKAFKRRVDLNRHSFSHTGLRPFKCDVCAKSFGRETNLKRHCETHTGDKPYVCTECQKAFSRKSSLERHYLVHRGEKPFKCENCSKSFLQISHLKTHILQHTGERPYKCEVCQKSFREACVLKKHYLVHDEEKQYVCPECPKAFSLSSSLKNHLLSHTGGEPYKCDQCPKSFIYSSHLKKHQLTHTTEKPHKCETCSMSFADKTHLAEHLRIHTGEKPYVCSQCQRAFSAKQSFKRHLRVHSKEKTKGLQKLLKFLNKTKGKPYVCPECQKSFSSKQGLKGHLQHAHTEEK